MKEDDPTATAVSEVSDRGMISHLGAGFYPVNAQFDVSTGSLQYPPSDGPWLERLCFLLLRSQGFVPRYFGNPGQKDRGVDLMVTSGDQLFVYQCKNVHSFSPGDMAKALKRFEDEWLKASGLPKPNKFILCCPSLLREREPNEEWTTLEREFQSRTGVEVEYWHRNFLDETLRSMPDIVAEVFSDQIAKLFCECDDWNYDQFAPVVADSPDRYIKRYQERKATNRIYLDRDLADTFTEKLERNCSVLIMGLPGSGKTTTSFALIEELPNRRVYYVTLRESISDNDLVNGVRNRLSRQTIFLVDDCQGRFGQLDSVMSRVNRLLQNRRNQAFFVFLTRTTPTPGDLVRGDEMTEFEEELKQADAVMGVAPDAQFFHNIIKQAKPHFANLSQNRLSKIFELTGHDLFLLDQLLETINDPEEIDSLGPEPLFEKTLRLYFGAPTVLRPGFMNLAALAQLELAPRVAEFPYDLKEEDRQATADLVVLADRPPRYFFLHSSAAELIFRALAWNVRVQDHTKRVGEYLIAFFKDRFPDDELLAADLPKAVSNRLKLTNDKNEDSRLKSLLLADEDIRSLIDRCFDRLPLNLLASSLIVLKETNSPAIQFYEDLARHKVEDGTVLELITTRIGENSLFLEMIEGGAYPSLLTVLGEQIADLGRRLGTQPTDVLRLLELRSTDVEPSDLDIVIRRSITSGRPISSINLALHELKSGDEATPAQPDEQAVVEGFLQLIAGKGTIFEFLIHIQRSSLGLAYKLIADLDDALLDQLVQQTISYGHSIGTLTFALRELKQSNEALLTRFEEKLGSARLLSLIAAEGSISELFKTIGNSSLPMAEKLIAMLDDPLLDQLLEQTISSGLSIGTLDLALRELKQNDAALLTQLEGKIGAARFLRLIAANGSIFELFRVIEHSSLPLAEKLTAALDDPLVDQLVEKTISSGRSIGTLHLALRELKQNDEALLTLLEEKIGAARFLRLIATNGSIFELFKVIQHSSLPMAEKLIGALDDPLVDQLVEQTISSGRSIGTLDFTLRELKRNDEALLTRLEVKIGAARFLRLIAANGSIFELFRVIQHSSLPMAEKLIAALDDPLVDQLVQQTISSGRSIGTLDLTLRKLKQNDEALLTRLEEKIGVARFLRLIAANGSIFRVVQSDSTLVAADG